jgi:hypothetical protein
MTKSELDNWRARVPFLITVATFLPLIYALAADTSSEDKLVKAIVVPASWVLAFIYSACNLRGYHWRRELDKHVGESIRRELLSLLPDDLNATDEERQQLREKSIYRKLTGVFWEAIDSDDELRRHKEHFYKNGALYTTALDLYIILPGISVIYSVIALFSTDQWLFLILYSAALLAIAAISRWVALPSCRRRHLELSDEQLDLLKRKKKDFVQEQYRDIVTEWRKG